MWENGLTTQVSHLWILLPFGSHLVGLDRTGGLVVQVGIDTIQGFPFYSYIVSAVLGRVRSLA